MTSFLDRETRVARDFGSRARGSALILVMAILGILFVTGMTFLTTMNFESQRISIERAAGQDEVGVEFVESIVGDILRESLMPIAGAEENASELGKWNTDDPLNPFFDASSVTWAELPMVHGLIAQIEPYRPAQVPPAPPLNPIFGYYTNLEALNSEQWVFSPPDNIETSSPNETGPGATVDSDGDGIPDTRQVQLVDRDPAMPGVPGGVVISSVQRGLLAKLVNGPTTAFGGAYVGLRVIAHGGMVNLSESHPSLIRTLFDDQPLENYHTPSRDQIHYSPHAEEASLRNRFFLPPRVLSPTVVQGDPLNPDHPAVPGGGDFAQWLFPRGEEVTTGKHRYWPFDDDEIPGDYQTWDNRMRPHQDNLDSGEYDRRHLVTTISYDDLRSRGGWMRVYNADTSEWYRGDVLDRMIEANKEALLASPPPFGECPLLPFEYADYPHTIPNGYRDSSNVPISWCECVQDRECTFNARKGKLRLSLPWLDEAAMDPDFPLAPEDLSRLIQDAFTMMLLNARSPYWGYYLGQDVNGDGETPEDEMFWHWNADRLNEIERTAAALTANMIDFADADELPTRVELRSADITNVAEFGRTYSDIYGPAEAEYAYGLERQPFITEVAAFDDSSGPLPNAYAVELFNPYDEDVFLFQDIDGDGQSEPVFALRVTETGEDIWLEGTSVVPRGGFLPILGPERDTYAWGLVPGQAAVIDPTLVFANGDTVYLLRRARHRDADGTVTETMIVVDQFQAVVDTDAFRSSERGSVTQATPWYAPLPTGGDDSNMGAQSIGRDNVETLPATFRPVEVLLANDWDSKFANAFPTTGSLLLLMRHANRSIDDPNPQAFTSVLSGLEQFTSFNCTNWNGDECTGEAFPQENVERADQIDNGRMPVFDEGKLHHFHLDYDPVANGGWQKNRPGELYHLPWGQLVFDYFTALPLYSEGPYSNPDGEQNFEVDEAAQPRVDLDGLRVHGRMNINAAPWMALKGLPFIPMEKIPLPFRARIRWALGLVVGGALEPLDPTEDEKIIKDYEAAGINKELAKAIVAYREVRELTNDVLPSTETTGDFGNAFVGRAWSMNSPTFRRGTGFMSVGELANVRHPGAVPLWPYRIDGGELDPSTPAPDYLDAIAVLVSLGDWVSVRSHVFTIYGTIRGDPDPSLTGGPAADDVDARAIRFQETVDRLPTFLGAPAPVRIGERVLTRYNDLRSD